MAISSYEIGENMKTNKLASILFLSLLLANCSSSDNAIPEPEEPETPEDTIIDYSYRVAQLNIETQYKAPILGKEKEHYVNFTMTIDSENDEWDYEGTGRIRGRGNSTWLWYPKKPYRMKLDEKASILGLAEEKDWVLLANYRDPTHLMNTFVFTAGNELGLPYTNHSRFVEVTLNGEYIGLYQLTEQVEQGKTRVNVADEGGLLISLDKDDGPELAPNESDNFWSEVYRMPICVKHPEDQSKEQLNAIKAEFALLEQAIKNHDYDATAKLMDMKSFIDYMLLQELVYNVEVDAPRSIYMHKDKDGKWFMGPLWDFDAGFDFDWSTMYTGHNYFMSYKELVLGTDPANRIGGYQVPKFFVDLFKNKRFVSEYKARWKEVKEWVMPVFWETTALYAEPAKEAMKRDLSKWPIDKIYSAEIKQMKNWLEARCNYLDTVIQNYPAGK
jgi:hypothetical protein